MSLKAKKFSDFFYFSNPICKDHILRILYLNENIRDVTDRSFML